MSRKGVPEPASNQSSIKRYEMDGGGGSSAPFDVSAARVNQRASSNSWSRRCTSVVTACAENPSINDAGKGQGWEGGYSIRSTSMPVSSKTSRAAASSSHSPGSTNPAMVE